MTGGDGNVSLTPARPTFWTVRRPRFYELLYQVFERLLIAAGPIARLIPDRILQLVLKPAEQVVKGVLFDCKMCGDCTLSATGMSCPMNCPKTLRNGPCGGIRDGGFCEVKPDMPCVWLNAWQGAAKMRNGPAITKVQQPLDQRNFNRSSWAAVMQNRHAAGTEPADTKKLAGSAKSSKPKPVSGLQAKLEKGAFCVTAEFNPPDTPAPGPILQAARRLGGHCASLNITDGAGANTHISSMSVAALLHQAGQEPVMQISCRDRNRIAIQADVLGAAALGIRNILCLTGDGIKSGDQTAAKPVFDLDCTSLLAMLKRMRDDGEFLSGRPLEQRPELFLGATSNPCAIDPNIEIGRIEKKIRAGAQFIQTQYCFDLAAFREFFDRFRGRGLHEECHFLVGVGPLSSARSADWMRQNIAGIRIPDEIINRLSSAENPQRQGIEICVELIEQIRAIEGVSGVHIMAFQQPELVKEIIGLANLDT